METQVKEVVAESVNVAVPTVIVSKVMDTQSGKGKNVQLRWLTKKEGGNSNPILSVFLGKLAQSFEEKRTALQFMENDVIDQLGITEGVNLNEVMQKAGHSPVRISISEISNDDYQAAKEAKGDNAVFGYQQKVNPSTGEVMGYESAPIWRKTFIDTVDGRDEYLQSDGSTVEISEDDITV